MFELFSVLFDFLNPISPCCVISLLLLLWTICSAAPIAPRHAAPRYADQHARCAAFNSHCLHLLPQRPSAATNSEGSHSVRLLQYNNNHGCIIINIIIIIFYLKKQQHMADSSGPKFRQTLVASSLGIPRILCGAIYCLCRKFSQWWRPWS